MPDRAVETWIFDLDNTLYAASSGMMELVNRRMTDYVARHLGLPFDEAQLARQELLRHYPSTMLGLIARHAIVPADYLDYCHDIEIALEADLTLDATLAALPGRKIVHTNAPLAWAERVLGRLGIERHFSGIFDIGEAVWQPKPHPSGYAEVLRRFDIDPATGCMIEDTAANLRPAFDAGLMTVLVHPPGLPPASGPDGHIHHRTDDLVAWLKRYHPSSAG